GGSRAAYGYADPGSGHCRAKSPAPYRPSGFHDLAPRLAEPADLDDRNRPLRALVPDVRSLRFLVLHDPGRHGRERGASLGARAFENPSDHQDAPGYGPDPKPSPSCRTPQ